MKRPHRPRVFSQINFALFVISPLLAGTLLVVGRASIDSGETNASNNSDHPSFCH